ncbi:unnamed protein product [Arctogadus glacialis]
MVARVSMLGYDLGGMVARVSMLCCDLVGMVARVSMVGCDLVRMVARVSMLGHDLMSMVARSRLLFTTFQSDSRCSKPQAFIQSHSSSDAHSFRRAAGATSSNVTDKILQVNPPNNVTLFSEASANQWKIQSAPHRTLRSPYSLAVSRLWSSTLTSLPVFLFTSEILCGNMNGFL